MKTTFSKYLFSYLATMLIPVLILGYISYEFYLDFFTESLLKNKTDTLSTISATLDMQFKQLHVTLYRISNEPKYTTRYQEKSYSEFYEINQELSKIQLSNDFLFDVQYINNELKYIYTPTGRYTFENYESYGSALQYFDKKEIINALTNLEDAIWLSSQPTDPRDFTETNLLAYVLPIERSSIRANSSVMFFIEKRTLDKVAGSALSGKNSQLLIVDKEDTILYHSDTDFILSSDTFLESLHDIPEKTPVHLNNLQKGADIVAYTIVSEETSGLRYICLLDYNEITQPLNNVKNIFLIALGAIFLLGSVAITLSMKINYSPIRKLGRLSKTLLPNKTNNIDEIQAAELAITTISQSHQNVLLENQFLQREGLLISLLQHNGKNAEEILSKFPENSIFLEGPSNQLVVIFYGHQEINHDRLHKISVFLESSLSSQVEVYSLIYSEDNSIILFLSGSLEEIKKTEQILQNNQKLLLEELSQYIIGISNPFEELSDARTYFQQALISAKYQTSDYNGSIICFSDINSDFIYQIYPNDNLTALYNAILMGNISRIEFAIELLIPYLKNMGSSFFLICLGYDIVNTALRAMRELNFPTFEFKRKYPELLLKSQFSSIDDIINIVKMLSTEICTFVNQNSTGQLEDEVKKEDDITSILEYIRLNYTDCSLSAKTLADHFGMSISNFSHFFKNRTGKVISHHISALRYEKAKELLRTTEHTISQVAEQSGYYHISTFMRHFKQFDQTTPNTYRNKFKEISSRKKV